MATGVNFDDAAAEQLEALYKTEDAGRRRRAVIGALKPTPGERVLDIGTGPGSSHSKWRTPSARPVASSASIRVSRC